ncbi:hypothetical protein HJC23_012836 [Cyclotella cryptica]|uniref:LRRK2 ARM repeat domain-containing protein n=1 Tax=Cyclotella cryptica TaxID=29204 RepID=A0ABD3Q2P1_9STRA|eukprot:CCRYP_009417-RA/>CCRYP_009417-RA protein AED:0.09 eAED:0.09 QI:299/1/1/1/0/0/2/508/693
MDTFGNDLSYGGQVLTKSELISRRERNGECVTCGQKCFNKKLFKMVPITIPGVVLEGRCLACNPQDPKKEEVVASCVAAPQQKQSASRKSRRGDSRKGTSSKSLASSAGSVASSDMNCSSSSLRRSASLEVDGVPASPSASGSRPRRNRLRVAADAVVAASRYPHAASAAAAPSATRRHSSRDTIEEESDDDNHNHAQQQSRLPPLTQNPSRRENFARGASKRPSEIMFQGLKLDDVDSDDHTDSSGGGREDDGPSIIERKALAAIHNPNNNSLDVLNIMLTHSTSAVVQNEGLHALSLVLRTPNSALLMDIQRACGYEIIVSAMGKCARDAMAQTNACKVLFLAGAAGEEQHQVAMGSAGAVEALGDAMREFEDDMIVLEGCLLALSNLCIPEENLSYFLEANLIKMTVEIMGRSVENCGLQEHGCAVLANLALHHKARRRIREAGGCDTIVVSMVVNPMDVELQSQALVALRNLCAKDEENRILLACAGAIDAVIGAMQCHRNDAKIQGLGSWVLSILGSNNDNKLYIGENGGIDVIVRSMWVHPDDAGVQEKALRALWTLSVEKALRWPIVEVNSIAAVVAAMQTHPEDASVQEKGCGVLTNLAATTTKLKVQIVQEGALDVAVMAMVLHGDNEVLNERAVSLIKKLCVSDNVEAMMAANVSPMMTMVSETFASCQEKAKLILDFLGDRD